MTSTTPRAPAITSSSDYTAETAPSSWRCPTPTSGACELRSLSLDDLSGRGLVIVDALAANWNVRPRDPGKTVWAHLAIEHGKSP
ncbi:hypothetical protein [Streptomyces sp. NPDC001750]|uniref:hypothetical protein n=1 Tax=unclassified Streptomyces TaxID=2593676 RepID=UPI003695FFDE